MRPRTRPGLVGGAAALGLLLVLTAYVWGADVRPAASENFFFDGRTPQYVVPSESEFLIKIRPSAGRPAARRPDWLPSSQNVQSSPAGRFPDPVGRLEASLAQRGLYMVRGGMTRSAAATHPEVEWALPVLYRPGSESPLYLTDHIVMQFDPGVSEAEALQIIRAVGCEVARHDARRPRRYVLRITDVSKNSPLATANALHRTRGVEYAHPDFILPARTCDAPAIADPLYADQWNLDGAASKGASPNADINVEAAWSIPVTGEGIPGIRVAVIDDSVEKDHPDLVANYFLGKNFNVSPGDPAEFDPSPSSYYEIHGTCVAGLAVGAANSIGIRGVAPRCGLIGIKGLQGEVSQIADAFYYAMDPNGDGNHVEGAAVITNSWQLTDGQTWPTDLANAIEYVAAHGRNGKGCVVLFASGNSSHTVNGISVLAQLPSVICVGGSNSFATHTVYSDVGPEISVVAPTSDSGPPETRTEALSITTTDDTGYEGYNSASSPDGDYMNSFGGTSASTPTVAGACALVLSQNPELTALQVRQIVEHTAVQIDPVFAQIDGISGHSHRFGYGRVDAGAAAVAAATETLWPAPVQNLACTVADNTITVSWTNPPSDFAAALVVCANQPFAWRPTDGTAYTLNTQVAPGVTAVADTDSATYVATNLARNGYFFAVYPHTGSYYYGWGRECHGFVGETVVFYDDSEGTDPGWTHGGAGDVWQRSVPTSYVSPYGWDTSVYRNGPLVGRRNFRAINGDYCWGTAMNDWPYAYQPNSAAWLQTPTIDLRGLYGAAFLTFYDWSLMETPYDHAEIKVVDEAGSALGTLTANWGGDYDWTPHAFDLSAFTNQRIRIRFELYSDDTIERDGWFIDEVKVISTAPPNLPPVASGMAVRTKRGFPVSITLDASGPEPLDVLTLTITSLPAHGTLSLPGGGAITTVPYDLADGGRTVTYTPESRYAGLDAFTFRARDYHADSNPATVNLTVDAYTADFDHDGDVDLTDFGYFQLCFGGPNRPVIFECSPADLDGDQDVDVGDFLVFQGCFNGPNKPPRTPCPFAP